MRKKENNYAFIDSQNVNLAIRELGWKLDFRRFHVYLKEKYSVKPFLRYMNDLQQRLAYKRKGPERTEPRGGDSSVGDTLP